MKYQNKLSNSNRKFIRKEKAKIKKQFLEAEQQKLAIAKLYERFTIKQKVKGVKKQKPQAITKEGQQSAKKNNVAAN